MKHPSSPSIPFICEECGGDFDVRRGGVCRECGRTVCSRCFGRKSPKDGDGVRCVRCAGQPAGLMERLGLRRSPRREGGTGKGGTEAR